MDQGTFLTPKHDPSSLNTTYNKFRSVLSEPMSASLYTFIKSRDYEINVYNDNRYHNDYYEIISNSQEFTIIGGGVPSQSFYTSSVMDRLSIVSGSNNGWHCFAENSSNIQLMTGSNDLIYSGSLK